MAVTTLIDDYLKDYLKLEKEKIEQLIYGVEPKTATEMHKREELWKQAMVEMGRYKAGMRPPQTFNIGTPYHIHYANAFDQLPTYPQVVVKLNNEKENEKMDAKKCDRCGKLYTETCEPIKAYLCGRVTDGEKATYTPEKIKELNTYTMEVKLSVYGNKIDMCPNCRKKLKEFFESGAEEAKE